MEPPPPSKASSQRGKKETTIHHDNIKTFLKTHAAHLNSINLSHNSVFKCICQSRGCLEELLQQYSLKATPDLISHLWLLANAPSSLLFESIKSHYSDDVVRVLMKIIDANAIKTVCAASRSSSDGEGVTIHNSREANKFPNLLKTRLIKNFPVSRESSLNKSAEKKFKLKSKELRDDKIKLRENIASVLRTGAIYNKSLQKNDAIIEELIAGANNPLSLEMHLNNIVKLAHDREMHEIQRRHLLGLISWEEAKLAKIASIECKQMRASDLKRDKCLLRMQMKKEIERSVSKSKHIIRRTHINRLILKKKRFDVAWKKKNDAENVKRLQRNLREQLEEDRRREFEHKVNLIRRIRDIERKKLNEKSSIDCNQWSINEKSKSIENVQRQRDDENVRRKRIQSEREKRKQLMQSTEALIEIGRKISAAKNHKKVKGEHFATKMEANNDILRLNAKLNHLKRLVSDRSELIATGI